MKDLAQKAERLLELHQGPKTLLLPNIWDVFGAKTLVSLGYPAIATASASVAYSLGWRDGEKIPFERMLSRVSEVAGAVEVPVTADLEGGYADRPEDLAKNMVRALEHGVAGINLEDTHRGSGKLYEIERQCDRIRAVREAAESFGIHLVINARTDVFLRESEAPHTEKLNHCIRRLTAYREAGADCVYPIPLGDVKSLRKVKDAVEAPVNAYAGAADASSLVELEQAGIQRVSFGPTMFRATMGRLQSLASHIWEHGDLASIHDRSLSGKDVDQILG